MIGYTSVGYGCQSALGWQIPCHSRRPLPCLLLQECAEKLLCEQSQVSQPRSIDDSLERVVPWPDELHWLTGGHWTLDFKPQSDDILGENRSMVVHGGLRSTASWISGAAGNIWWSLAPGFFLPTRCLKDRAWAKKGSWGTDLWICVPKQDLLSRLGAVSTGLRTSVWREMDWEYRIWGSLCGQLGYLPLSPEVPWARFWGAAWLYLLWKGGSFPAE